MDLLNGMSQRPLMGCSPVATMESDGNIIFYLEFQLK